MLDDQLKEQLLEDLEQALYASKIISHAQGFMFMQEVHVPIKEDVDIY
jgi:6-phosphogluconate dehydrogenase